MSNLLVISPVKDETTIPDYTNLTMDLREIVHYEFDNLLVDWCLLAGSHEDKTIHLALILKEKFPTLDDWNENKPFIHEHMMLALPVIDREVWNDCKFFIGTRGQSPEQKSLIIKKKVIQNKLGRWIKKLESKMKYVVEPITPSNAEEHLEMLRAKCRKEILIEALKSFRVYCKKLSECDIDVSKVRIIVENPFYYQQFDGDEPVLIDFETMGKIANDANVIMEEIYSISSQFDTDNPQSTRLVNGYEDNTPNVATTPDIDDDEFDDDLLTHHREENDDELINSINRLILSNT